MKDITKQTDEDLARELVEMKKVMEELKSQFDERKEELQKRNPNNVFYFPNFETKVLMTEGKLSSEYDVIKIYVEMAKECIQEEFPNIVKINKSQVSNIKDISTVNLINSILLKNVTTTLGTPSLSVAKMNKTELKEHTSTN